MKQEEPETKERNNIGAQKSSATQPNAAKAIFEQQYSSSDAESKVGWRWPEVPHWESQLAYIIELIVTSLVGHVGMEKLP